MMEYIMNNVYVFSPTSPYSSGETYYLKDGKVVRIMTKKAIKKVCKERCKESSCVKTCILELQKHFAVELRLLEYQAV